MLENIGCSSDRQLRFFFSVQVSAKSASGTIGWREMEGTMAKISDLTPQLMSRLMGMWVLALCLAFGSGAVQAADAFRVAMVLPGSIADGGWNQQAYEGLKQLEGMPGFKVAYTENVKQSDIPQVVRGYADDGYELIIGHGFQFASLFQEIGEDYAKQKFFATTYAPQGKIPPNVMYLDARYYDVGYCIGALAALMSEKKIVGLVGGGDNPTQQNLMKVFKAGAQATVPGIKAFAVITGDYNDAAKGRETALTMVGNGADVISHTADLTGIGAIKGAAEAKVKVIGAFSDQTPLAPDLMGTSFTNNNLGIVVKVAEMAKDGSFEGGKEWKPDLSFAWGMHYKNKDHNDRVIPAATWAKFQTIWADVAAGKVDTSNFIK
jgi:basic membrane protein A and related proteins